LVKCAYKSWGRGDFWLELGSGLVWCILIADLISDPGFSNGMMGLQIFMVVEMHVSYKRHTFAHPPPPSRISPREIRWRGWR
jgi:hypothetical protein